MAVHPYNVVFEYTEKAGLNSGYRGVRFYTGFEDEEAFKALYTPDTQKRQVVIAKGITSEQAKELCAQAPLLSRLNGCLEEATDKKSGRVNPGVLRMELENVLNYLQI